MAKTCLKEGCTRNVWGGKFCIIHQYLRTDKKPQKSRNTPIRQISSKQRLKIPEQKALSEKDMAFYAQIWEDRPRICFETGDPLGNEPLTIYFHHVLAKSGRFARFRHKEWNIVLLAWQQHSNENYLRLLPKVQAYRDYLIKNLSLIEKGKLKEPLKSFNHEHVNLLDA